MTHNSLDFPRPYRRLLENQKTGASTPKLLPKNEFQNCSTKDFPKNIPDIGVLETNCRHETQTWTFLHMLFYIKTQYNTELVLGFS